MHAEGNADIPRLRRFSFRARRTPEKKESVDAELVNIGQAPEIPRRDNPSDPTPDLIDTMHTDVLSQYYRLTGDSPDAVKFGGMNLFELLGANFWDPDGYWEEHWRDQFDENESDPFGIDLPEPRQLAINPTRPTTRHPSDRRQHPGGT